jgi:hypothetical protein
MRKWIDLCESDRPDYLYHGTWRGNLPDILEDGLTAPSYWGTYEVAQSYQMQFGKEGIILRVPIGAFSEEGLEVNEHLYTSLADDDDGVNMPTTWEESLSECGSVVYQYSLQIDPDDIVE